MTRLGWLVLIAAIAGAAALIVPGEPDASPSPATTTTTAPYTSLIPPLRAERQPSTTTSTTTPPGARLRSTSYCLTSGMASGRRPYVGAVAANRYPIGTRLTASPNPWGNAAMVFVVEDRHQPGATQLDFAMPGECARALRWGNRRFVTVHVLD